MSDECQESYNACMASRGGRIAEVVAEAQPGDTEAQLAERAGVTRQAINRYKKQTLAQCNKPSPVKLKELYADDIPYWSQRPVKAVETALQGCSREQLAYLFSEVLPIFHANLIRKEVS